MGYDNIKKSFVSGITRAVNSNIAEKTVNATRDVLNVVEKVKSGNPISVMAASVQALDITAKWLDIKKPDAFAVFVFENELVEISEGCLKDLIQSPVVARGLEKSTVFESEDFDLYCVQVGSSPSNNLYFKIYKQQSQQYLNYEERRSYLVGKHFSLEEAYKYVWEQIGGKGYVSTETSHSSYGRERKVVINSMVMDTSKLWIRKDEVARIHNEINKAKAEHRSRSYILAGPAGTGKSSFVNYFANSLDCNLLKLDPGAINSIGSDAVGSFVASISPDVVVFDDIDRLRNYDGEVLFLFENIKRSSPNTIIFATVNNFGGMDAAIKRPGRFDRVVWFNNPDGAERTEFFNFLLAKYSVVVEPHTLEQMINESNGFSHAYLDEMVYRIHVNGFPEETVNDSIKEFRITLGLGSGDDCDEDDDYEDDE